MKVDCSWSRDDLKTYLEQRRKVPNCIFLMLGTFFFFFVTYYGFQDKYFDNKVLILGFIIYFLILVAFLWAVTKLYVYIKLCRNDRCTEKAYGEYHIEADDEKIVSIVGDEEFSYEWKDITVYKVGYNYFFICTDEDKLGLCFRKEILKGDYDKLLTYVKKQMA